jgi:hypothetical protein
VQAIINAVRNAVDMVALARPLETGCLSFIAGLENLLASSKAVSWLATLRPPCRHQATGGAETGLRSAES